MRINLAILGVLYITSAVASPIGEWFVNDRTARVLIRRCGGNLCGNLSWTSDGKQLGRPVLIDMKPEGPQWTGTVVDVRDGTRYLAHIGLEASDRLKLDGCILSGAICSGEVWTRYR